MNKNKKIIAIVEARMNSSRLPGKHLLQASNIPMIGHLIMRLKTVKLVDEIVIAMTTLKTDDSLEKYVKTQGVKIYRGDENDVMGRVLKASIKYNADIICEVTGDCPIIDPFLVEHAINTFLFNNISYLNNARHGLPDGMGCQVFTTEALAKSYDLTSDSKDREHVTLHFKRNPKIFPTIYLPALKEYYWPELRVTLDDEDDYKVIKTIIKFFYKKNILFNCTDIINLIKSKPELFKMNFENIPK